MPIARIDHVNIRTPDLAGTVAFFRDVLEMEATPAPGTTLDQACWMRDAGGLPAIHIGKTDLTYPTDHWRKPAQFAPGSAAVHHVALNCEGYDEVAGRLASHGCETSTSDIPEIGLRQIFVEEANGILLELNFWAD